MLAVMKVNAAYVPLDAAFPIERLRFIMGDAEIKTIVSMSNFTERLAPLDVQKVFLDSAKRAIDKQDASRLAGVARSHDPVCYIIYTSGTTGNPKGVAIAQPSICNFVRVAAELYGYAAGRPHLPGHDHRLRFLDRGDLGAAGRGRDAGSRARRACP